MSSDRILQAEIESRKVHEGKQIGRYGPWASQILIVPLRTPDSPGEIAGKSEESLAGERPA